MPATRRSSASTRSLSARSSLFGFGDFALTPATSRGLLLRLDRDYAFVGYCGALCVECLEPLERRLFSFFPAMKPRAEVFWLVFAHDRGFSSALLLA